MARPKLKIEEKQVYELALLHCTNVEIAAVLDCSAKTLTGRFLHTLHKGREEGKIKLRRLQWQSAETGCYSMQIWLGKQYLGQTDKTYAETDTTIIIKHEYGKPNKPLDSVLEKRNQILN